MFAKIFVREIDFCYWIKKKVWFELGERYALAKEEKNYIFVHKVAVRSHYPFLKLAVEKIFVPRAASIWIENLHPETYQLRKGSILQIHPQK